MPLTLTSLGAAGTVTGSKHLLELDGVRILVDCGLFQGLKNLREQNWQPLPVPAESIDAVLLTHAHLDHSGYLPRLVRSGFEGPIIATQSTRDVAELILRDSASIHERDAEHLNRIRRTKHSPALPLYDTSDAEQAIALFETYPFDDELQVGWGMTVRFRRAGHILGAATIDVEWGGTRIAFSGDLGRYDDPLMPDPEPIPEADYIVIESTYGDRLHEPTDPASALLEVVERTIARGGTLVIPSFAVGRAQHLLYYLWRLREEGRLPNVPIYLDSPMAINASDLLEQHLDDHRLNAADCAAVGDIATYTRSADESKRLSASREPKIIISASGMATGGRVLFHLRAFAPDSRNTILLAGFQAAGTRGRALLEGAHELKIHGEWIPVAAEVANLPMLSAHADADELMRWLGGFTRAPEKVFIVHGEPQASEVFRARIDRELGWSAIVPRQDQVFEL